MKILVLEINYKLGNMLRTSGVDFYRLIQPMKALRDNTGWEIELRKDPFDGYPEKNWREIARNFDIIYTGYNMDKPEGYIELLFACLKEGTKLVVDVDDNIFEVQDDNPVYPRFKVGAKEGTVIRSIIENNPYLTCTTQELKDRILHFTKRPADSIEVLDNSIDEDVYYATPKKKSLHLFYSGTHTHKKDINLPEFKNALKRVMLEHPNLEFHSIGMYEPEFQIMFKKRYKFIDGSANFPTFINIWRDEIKNVGIGLCPLQDSEFAKCKSSVKWKEYSAGFCVTIASNVYPYKPVIENGKTGFLCSTEEEWYKAMTSMIENNEYRKNVVKNANREVMKKYNAKKNWVKYRDYFEKIYVPKIIVDRDVVFGDLQKR